MLRITVIGSAKAAEAYYIGNADYYLDENAVPSRWQGMGAERLGLMGEVTRQQFSALCRNRHPLNSKQLTAAMRSNRRSGYDFTFTASKSISVALALAGDERILKAFRSSIAETMQIIEQDAAVRVRKDGKDEDRKTGNLVWCDFVHTLSRPTGPDSVPQPALHAHVVVQNASFDPEEGVWKALQAGPIKTQAPYYQAIFRAKLAQKIQELGYEITARKGDFEIQGIPRSVIEKLSKRTEEIENLAKKQRITNPLAKARLGAKSRQRKNKAYSWQQLKDKWHACLTSEEIKAVHFTHEAARRSPSQFSEVNHIPFQLALDHLLERQSAVPERMLIAETLRRGLRTVTLEGVQGEIERADLRRGDYGGVMMVTTTEVMEEEKRLVEIVRKGQHTQRPLPVAFDDEHKRLNAGQRAAVEHMLTSTARFTAVRGVAGSGKTTLLKAAAQAFERAGICVTVVAPTAAAARITLRQDGLTNAETLQRFLHDRSMQQRARGQAVILDEASLTGMKDMLALAELAKSQDFRVAILGDARQHKAVSRGHVLAILEDFGGVKSVEVSEIMRQQGNAKEIVKLLADGRSQDAFDALLQQGDVVTAGHDALAAEYVAEVRAGRSVLAVCPTHAEGRQVSDEIRSRLRQDGYIAEAEQPYLQLVDLQLTEAERRDPATYEPGMVAEFIYPKGAYKRGQRIEVTEENRKELAKHSSAHRLYRKLSIPLSVGDRIRFTKGGRSLCGKRLENGSSYRVAEFSADGEIMLSNGWRVSAEAGHIASDWTVTSFASQSRTVDTVLIAQGSESFPATNAAQFYVAVSRGRRAMVYTDDVVGLKRAITRIDLKTSAMSLRSAARLRRRWHAFFTRAVTRRRLVLREAPGRALMPAKTR